MGSLDGCMMDHGWYLTATAVCLSTYARLLFMLLSQVLAIISSLLSCGSCAVT